MTDFGFDYKGEKYTIDVKECKDIFSQASGLMFKKHSKSLLFIFEKKKRRRIHSFFCKPFIAIWFDGNNVIEIRKIMKWKFSIRPEKKFDKLLEIPENSESFLKFSRR